VASQALNQFEVEPRQPFMLRDILPGPGWAPYQAPAQTFPLPVERASEETTEDGSCVKGMLAALAIEGIVAVSVFALWQAWHLIR
jgi:hypothetical protein